MSEVVIGVIGGSGLYEIEGITDLEEVRLDTPFGAPSDAYICGRLEGARCGFLPRHGRGHPYPPSEDHYLALQHISTGRPTKDDNRGTAPRPCNTKHAHFE